MPSIDTWSSGSRHAPRIASRARRCGWSSIRPGRCRTPRAAAGHGIGTVAASTGGSVRRGGSRLSFYAVDILDLMSVPLIAVTAQVLDLQALVDALAHSGSGDGAITP